MCLPLLPRRHASHRVKLVQHRLARIDDASVRIPRERTFEPGFVRSLRQQGAQLNELNLKMKLPAGRQGGAAESILSLTCS